MRLAYVADGRSPISRNWMTHFIEAGHEVHLVSTFDCRPLDGLASLSFVPVAFSRAGRVADNSPAAASGPGRRVIGVRLRTAVRDWFGPLTIGPAARRLKQTLLHIEPDLVHAMRIPFEGVLAAASDPTPPLLISSWGNDFTLHASGSPILGRQTRATMIRADGLHADCQRDLRLAWKWGFARNRLQVVLPSAGGVRREVFHPGGGSDTRPSAPGPLLSDLPMSAQVVVNPRGLRAYIRNDTFFRAVPLILENHPETVFVCPSMQGASQAQSWIRRLGIESQVKLWPRLSAREMADVFRRASVAVSPSEHDGTPNSLLEAMACGCFPVAGDLESVREWIEPGVNGLLVNPADAVGLARAVSDVLSNPHLRGEAAHRNEQIIADRADYTHVMAAAEAFYRQFLP
jgi:glycosyltransferase involved in cell wall biosynthesis